MKYFLFLFLFISLNAYSSIGLNTCGQYTFKGTPQIDKKDIVIFINEKTKSQIRLIVPLSEQYKITPYLKMTIEGELSISEINNLWNAQVGILKNIKISVPDPLNPSKNSFLKLVRRNKCTKEI